jgi:hypothetical protein
MKSERRQVVVHPAFAIEWRDVDDFCGEFGPYNGRYVPRYPPGWVAQCLRHLEELDLPPIEKARLFETAKQGIPHCSTPGDMPWNENIEWEKNVCSLLRAQPQALIIGNGLDPEPFKGWASGVREIRSSRKRSWEFPGTLSNYLAEFRPLLLSAPAAYLIDPYLDPFSQEIENLLRSIFEAIKGSRCYQIHLVICKKRYEEKARVSSNKKPVTKEQFETELKRVYASCIGRSRSLYIHLVDKPRYGGKDLEMHDRFFLTKFGAIQFGRGFVFKEREHPQESASVVDKSMHISLKHKYIDGVTRCYDLLPRKQGVPYPSGVTSLYIKG